MSEFLTEGMTLDQLCVPPGVPPECASSRREITRREWRLNDGGDPADIIDQFLTDVGIAPAALTTPTPTHDTSTALCGVAILMSSDAGAATINGATGPPSPVPAIPDLVLVAYEHSNTPITAATPLRHPITPPSLVWQRSWTTDEHASAVDTVRDAISRGDVYQVNVVSHESTSWPSASLTDIAHAVLALPANYSGTMWGTDWLVASASPECFVITHDGLLETRPIKGTAAATEQGALFLHQSIKERAEHVMIVDLERNDMARVAVPGTVNVPELFTLREWCGLWQAESTVTAQLSHTTTIGDIMKALCPPGSVTGTPKLSALETITAIEPVGRGPAMGTMGYITQNSLTMGLTIRTIAATTNQIHLWAGGGITWRSDPQAEVSEAIAKATPIKNALGSIHTRDTS